MRVLITGATGFVGSHLTDEFRAQGTEVIGLARDPGGRSDVPLLRADLAMSVGPIEHILREVRPDAIVHLAGYASPGKSFAAPEAAWSGNLTATRNLFDAVAAWGGQPRILAVSSGLIYGDLLDPTGAFSEDDPLRPISPYAVSKAAVDLLAYQVTRHPGLDVVRARPFNHLGPGQSPEYAVPAFARQIAAVAAGQQPPVIAAGDLSPARDLTDVRDVVRAYRLLIEKGRTGEAYNVGSGQTVTMRDVLARLTRLAGVSVTVHPRPAAARPVDPGVVRANVEKLTRETGWEPRVSLDQTLSDVLAEWRAATAAA